MNDHRHLHRNMERLRRHPDWDGAAGGGGSDGRLRRAYRPLYWRARRVAAARRATREYGPEVARLWGVSLWRQFAQQVALALRYGSDAEMYYRYRLYQLDDLHDAALFVPFGTNIRLRGRLFERLGCDRSVNDKRVFAARCRAAGLPTVPLVAEFGGGEVAWGPAALDGEGPCGRLPARDLFSKPASAKGGDGAARWRWDGAAYVGEDSRRLAPDALVEHLRADPHPQVLQPRLCNAPGLDALGIGALCTIRIITARRPGRNPEYVESYVRMSTKDGPVDNFAQGGLAAPIDPETGVLGPGIRKELEHAAQDYDVHPVTGHPITGFRVSQWPDALALVLRAHQALTDIPMIGWDVAATTDGVILLEANTAPSAHGQQPGCRPLGATPYAQVYLDALKA